MELITKHLCKASNIGVHGNLFGGQMISWLDEAAALMATEICKTLKMVTVQMDEVKFKIQIKENHRVNIYGEILNIGTTSITLHLVAKRYNVYTKEETEACSINMTFVRISDEGTKRAIDLEVREQYKQFSKNKQNDK